MNIRPYRTEDEAALLEMLRGFMRYREEAYSGESLVFEEIPDEEGYLASLLEQFPKNDVFLVAEQDGKLHGYIVAEVQIWKPGKRNPKGHIHSIYVHEEKRGSGLAEELLRAASKRLIEKGCNYLELEVNAGNKRAKGFYDKLGFVDCSHVLRRDML